MVLFCPIIIAMKKCVALVGIFYDYIRPDDKMDVEKLFLFQQSNGNCFVKAYIPIINKRKDSTYNENHKYWQEIRRGRYVEFNLIHDRGTILRI
jgi:coproporphyrinogen III oxidase